MPSTWSTTTAITTAVTGCGGAGSVNASLLISGKKGGLDYTTVCEEFDGVTWETIDSVAAGRDNFGSCGTTTAAIMFQGYPNTYATEEYNGTSWSAGGNCSANDFIVSGFGILTAAVGYGGDSLNSWCQEYNGTSWSTGGTVVVNSNGSAGMGTLTAGLAAGGEITGSVIVASNMKYDGTTWTTGDDLLTARMYHGGAGTQSAALVYGGTESTTAIDSSESYNGTTWSVADALVAEKANQGDCGIQRAALSIGGMDITPTYSAGVEVYEYVPGVGEPCYIDEYDAVSVEGSLGLVVYPLAGSTVFGHISGHTEANGLPFLNYLTGTGVIQGSGNSEVLELEDGSVMTGPVILLGSGVCSMEQNKYGTGGEGTMYYRTGATESACTSAGWTEYTAPFSSLGYMQMKVEK